MTTANDMLELIKNNPIPLYAMDWASTGAAQAVLLTTPQDADEVILEGLPVGRTPLEAAQRTFDGLVGAMQLRFQAGAPEKLEELLDGDGGPGNNMLEIVAKLKAFIDEETAKQQ